MDINAIRIPNRAKALGVNSLCNRAMLHHLSGKEKNKKKIRKEKDKKKN